MKKYFSRYTLVAVMLLMSAMTARSIVRTHLAKSRSAVTKKVGYCHCNTSTGENWCCCYDPGPDPDCNPIKNCNDCHLGNGNAFESKTTAAEPSEKGH